ncbi:HNH endonuclease [Pseudomonas hormoni]
MTADELRLLVSYDPETGALFRKTDLAANAKAGAQITCVNSDGYIQAVIRKKFFYGHRLAWMLFYGSPPEGRIDHINGNRSDNRISNLRIASAGQNVHNTRLRKDNSSGVKGVSWHAVYRKWVARLSNNRVLVYEEYFDSLEEATNAIRVERLKHHNHFSNHGYR